MNPWEGLEDVKSSEESSTAKPWEGLDAPRESQKPRGLAAEVGQQLMGGFYVDLPKQIGQAMQWMSEEGKLVHAIGKKMQEGAERAEKENPEFEPQVEDAGIVRRALSSGARALPSSYALALGGAAAAPAGVLATGAASGAGAYGIFGASQAQETYDKLKKQGVSEEDAKQAAYINLMIEGTGETIGNIAGVKLLGVLGKTGVGKTPVAAAIEGAAGTSVWLPFAKQLPKTALVEAATEFGQAYGETAVEQAHGARGGPSPLEAGVQGAEAALGMTALLAPFGLAGHTQRAKQNKRVADALQNPNADPVQRMAAAKLVYDDIADVSPEAAKAWSENSAIAIQSKAPIVLDESFAQKKSPSAVSNILNAKSADEIVDAALAPILHPEMTDADVAASNLPGGAVTTDLRPGLVQAQIDALVAPAYEQKAMQDEAARTTDEQIAEEQRARQVMASPEPGPLTGKDESELRQRVQEIAAQQVAQELQALREKGVRTPMAVAMEASLVRKLEALGFNDPQEAQDAVQERGAAQVDVRQRPGDGKTLAGGNAQGQAAGPSQGARQPAGGKKPGSLTLQTGQPAVQAGAGAAQAGGGATSVPPAPAAAPVGVSEKTVAAAQQGSVPRETPPVSARIFGRPVAELTDNALRTAATNHRMSAHRAVALAEIERRRAAAAPPAKPKAETRGVERVAEEIGAPAEAVSHDQAPAVARLTARAVEKAFGKKVVFFRAGEQGYDERGKARWKTDGIMFPDDPGTVYVNVNSNRKWQALIGHETTHVLKRTDEAVYNELQTAVNAAMKAKAFAWAKQKYGERDAEIQNEEVVANVVGDQMHDPLFWLEVFKQTKNVRALARAVLAAVGSVHDKIVRSDRVGYDTKNIVTDMRAVRAAVAKAYTEWERGTKGREAKAGKALESKPDDVVRIMPPASNDRLFGDERSPEERKKWEEDFKRRVAEKQARERARPQPANDLTFKAPRGEYQHFPTREWWDSKVAELGLRVKAPTGGKGWFKAFDQRGREVGGWDTIFKDGWIRLYKPDALESKPADRSAEPFRPANANDMKVLRIPPGWTDVYVAANPKASLVAVGTDKSGRTQYLYSAAHTSAALMQKFKRLREFNDALPGIMERIEKDAAAGKEEAVVARLIANTGFRVGGEEVRGEAEAIGATTLRAEHVKVEDSTIYFDFPGKRGVTQLHDLTNDEIARDIEARMQNGGRLFSTTDARVRAYLSSVTGGRFKVHDFRTWNATDAARQAMAGMDAPTTPEQYWDRRDRAMMAAADKIGDTQAVAEEVYVDKLIFEEWRRAAGVAEDATRPRRKREGASRANERALRDASVSRGEGQAGERAALQSKPDNRRAGNQAAGESNTNPIADARAAVAYNRTNPPKKNRLGNCHLLTFQKVIGERLTQIIGVVNGWADRARPSGELKVYIWHSVAYDPKSSNFWEPITNRWYTRQAMEAFGFEPVVALTAKQANALAQSTEKVPDQQVYSENSKPIKGAEADFLLPGDFTPDWKVIEESALQSKPDDDLEAMDRMASEEEDRQARYFGEREDGADLLNEDEDYKDPLEFEQSRIARGEYRTTPKRRVSEAAMPSATKIVWATRPDQGDWISDVGNGRYAIEVRPDGYAAMVNGEEDFLARNRTEALNYLNDLYVEEINDGIVPDPNADKVILKKFKDVQVKRVVDGLRKLAQAPGIFRLNKSDKKKLPEIVREVDTEKVVSQVMPAGGNPEEIQWIISFRGARPAFVYENVVDGFAFVDASSLEKNTQLGSFLYPAVLNWAKNNGIKLVPDPNGLTEINTFRRTEQMFSAALKFGSTEFMSPHVSQKLYGWNENPETKADHDRNIAIMAITAMDNTFSVIPEAEDYTYNFNEQRVEDGNGKPVSLEKLKKLGQTPAPDGKGTALSRFGTGPATIARAVFVKTLIRGSFTPKAEIGMKEFLSGKLKPSEVLSEDKAERALALYSKPEARAITKTPEFKKWFGDSKVVDEKGEPMVMYHGTDADIEKFDIRRASWESLLGQGFYFAKSAKYASGSARGRGANVMPVYLAIKNPAPLEIAEDLAFRMETRGDVKKTAFRDALEKLGYDGIITHETVTPEGEPDEIVAVALRPQQIKSAIGNRGTFDPKSASILESKPSYIGVDPVAESAARKAGIYRPEKPLFERVKEQMPTFAKRMRQGLVDQFSPIKEVSYEGYMLSRMSKGADGALEAMLIYGKPFLEDGALNVTMEDGGLANILVKLEGEHDRFMAWIAGNRAAQLKTEGRERLFEDAEIDWLKSLNKGQMKGGGSRAALYAEVHKQFNAYSKAVLDIVEKQGLIDAESRAVWEKDFYVPFYRNMDEEVSGPTVRSGLVSQQAFKKLKGGTQELNDLLSNTLQNWSHLLSAAMKNKAALVTMEAAVNAGGAIEVSSEYQGKQMQIGKVLKASENGRERYFVLEDPFLIDAISSLESFSFGPIGKLFETTKRWLTIGVTANPAFKIRNLIRDSVSAIGVSELGYNPLVNVSKAWADTAHSSQTRASLLASGGIIRFGTQLEGSRAEYVRDLIDEGVDADTILDKEHKVVAALKLMWDRYQEFGDRGENVNRVALYKQLREEGKSHLEASYAARDLMDFSMQGSWRAIRFLTQTVPFFNARLQGLYKGGRAAVENPRKMGAVVGAVAIASLIPLFLYHDDDDWKKREDWDRDNFWWFKIGDVAFRIPKPFEIGAVGTAVERMFEYGLSDEMTGKRLAKRLGSLLMDNLAMNPVPQIARPLIEMYANKDFFRGRPIETMGMEKLSPAERIGRGTSALAQLVGKANVLSPVQIDHAIHAYLGWLGTAATTILDYGLRPAMGIAERPERTLKDTFVVGNFIETLPTNSSRYVTEFYENSKKIEQAYNDWRHAINMRDPERAKELREAGKEDIALHGAVSGANKQLAALNKLERQIEANKTMTPEEKRKRLDRIDEIKGQAAKRFADLVQKRRAAQGAVAQ